MRLLLGLVVVLGVLGLTDGAAASSKDASPDGEIAEAWLVLTDAKPPLDPMAFSNDLKSSVNQLFTFREVTVMFSPSQSGLALRISGRF
jgi:hypothetical protein